jgi:hypothetical protein
MQLDWTARGVTHWWYYATMFGALRVYFRDQKCVKSIYEQRVPVQEDEPIFPSSPRQHVDDRDIRVDVEDLHCSQPQAGQSVICGQSLYGALGSGDEWLGYVKMGSRVSVSIEDATPIYAETSIDSDGRFEVSLPVRTSHAQLCIEGYVNGNVSESDRCRRVTLEGGSASVAIYCNLWPYSMHWSSGLH